MADEYVAISPFSLKVDKSKPVTVIQDKEGKLWLEYFDQDNIRRRIPISVVILPQELRDAESQIPLSKLFGRIDVNIEQQTSDALKVYEVQVRKDTLGYSTAPLGANASVTLGPYDAIIYKYVNITVFADQAGTLYIEQSSDGANWDISESISVSANTGQGISREVIGRYVRVRYVNGATAQTVFRLYVWGRVT